ncbi:unnamed protein product [Agarophyton chilense]
MHLWLLGWVKHLLSLCIGSHQRCRIDKPAYVIGEGILRRINESLGRRYREVPSSWGRPSESFKYLGGYKAEDFTNVALHYVQTVFNGDDVGGRVAMLWAFTSKVTHVLFKASPTIEDISLLNEYLQRTHQLFLRVIYTIDSEALCLTPTTRAILHLPQMLQDCGPPRNVSQFLVERVAEMLCDMRRSSQKPEANLFFKTHNLFSLNMLGGCFGREMEEIDTLGSGSVESRAVHSNSPESSDSVEDIHGVDMVRGTSSARGADATAMIVTGSVKEVGGEQSIRQVVEYAQTMLPVTAYDVSVSTLRLFRTMKLSFGDVLLKLESHTELMIWERQGIYRAKAVMLGSRSFRQR